MNTNDALRRAQDPKVPEPPRQPGALIYLLCCLASTPACINTQYNLQYIQWHALQELTWTSTFLQLRNQRQL